MFQVIEAFPGVRLIRLPLPFELNHVHVGLVRLEDGYLLIDTGFDTEESFHALEAALGSVGVAWREIRRIVVTHMHPDHVGLVGRLVGLTGAELLMHRAEAEHLNSIVAAGKPPWIDLGLKLAGSPASMIAAIHHSIAHLRDSLKRVAPDVELEGGEELPTALGPAQVIWTPGHTVGHICLYWPGQRLFYSGDHLIEKITPNIGWLPGRDCLAEYMASLRKLLPLEIDTILPSHGDPFSGHTGWVAQTIAHHEARCGRLLAKLADGPETAHHLVPALWSRRLSPFHYHFALFEVLAHLEYLQQSGRLNSDCSDEGARLWSAPPAVSHSACT